MGERGNCCARPSCLDVDMALRYEPREEMLKRAFGVAAKREGSGAVSVSLHNVCTRRWFHCMTKAAHHAISVSPSGIHHSLQLVGLPRTP